MTEQAISDPPLRIAVVVRTFAWDPFIERQLARYAAVSQGTDLYLSVDDTSGTIGSIPFDRVFRSTDADLIASGLPNRTERGALCWWNNDYPQYLFQQHHPDYDYYVFVEYDSAIQGSIAAIVAEVAAQKIDLVAAPIPYATNEWFWWYYTRLTYPEAETRVSINCISILSKRAVQKLFARRVEMGADRRVRSWPISEAFVRTEIERAGYSFAPLSAFGSDTGYDWFPPVLEDDLATVADSVFVHPVLDKPRYINSVLNNGRILQDYEDPKSALRQRLNRFAEAEYAPKLMPAFKRRQRILRMEEWQRTILRVRFKLARARSKLPALPAKR